MANNLANPSGALRRMVIRTDSSVETFSEPVPFEHIRALVKAQLFDVVALHHLGLPLHVMLVDDAGYESRSDIREREDGTTVETLTPIRARKPVNMLATQLYHLNCQPGTTHQIVGDVYIAPDDDFASEPKPL